MNPTTGPPVSDAPARALLSLGEIAEELKRDRPIAELEQLETAAKALIGSALLSERLSARDAIHLAAIVRDLGFLRKYKPYAVKAAHLLGYSIFLQRPAEGFSFQIHRDHKVEVFHILATHSGARVFICPYSEWRQVYEPGRFARWLAGASDAAYDRYSVSPQVGDVYRIDQLETVHTVIGCDLEEYANTSFDMVTRLHDQNSGRPIPPEFQTTYVAERLRSLVLPDASYSVSGNGQRTPIPEEVVAYGETVRVLSDAPIAARIRSVTPNAPARIRRTEEAALALHLWQGSATLRVHDDGETPPLPLPKGSITLISPHCSWSMDSVERLTWSEQEILPREALAGA